MRKNFRLGRNLRLQFKMLVQGIFLLTSLFWISSCNQSSKQKEKVNAAGQNDIYYCPMHPEVQQNHPGKCDKCGGMELVKKEPDGTLNNVLRPANTVVLSTIKTVHPEKKEIPIIIETQGYIDYDDRAKHNIASTFDGRIEKLYVRYNFQSVRQGQKIFDMYSPELVTAQQNLVYLLNTDKDAIDLIDAAKQKLKLLGMGDAQITNLVSTHRVQNSISVFSKWNGHIHEGEPTNQNVFNSESQGMQMDGNNTPNIPKSESSSMGQTTSPLSAKEGMYVNRGQTVLNVIDENRVVAKLQIKAQDISKVKAGQIVTIEIEGTPKSIVKGRISFIEPLLKQNSKTLLVRVEIDNSEKKYRIGTLVKGSISVEAVEGLWVPASAVVDLGKSKIVWVKRDGNFMAQKVETGAIAGSLIEITDGLMPRDEIATEGHYLTDSEGFIKTNENED